MTYFKKKTIPNHKTMQVFREKKKHPAENFALMGKDMTPELTFKSNLNDKNIAERTLNPTEATISFFLPKMPSLCPKASCFVLSCFWVGPLDNSSNPFNYSNNHSQMRMSTKPWRRRLSPENTV